jgi:PPP family 3-phenylpropionic acid transporter
VTHQTAKSESGIVIGLTYAISFGIYGVFFPFIPLILRAKGFSDAEVGIALSAAGLSSMLGPPIFAHAADRVVQFRRLMPVLLLISTVFVWLLDRSVSVFAAFAALFLLYLFLIPALSLLDSFTMDFILRNHAPDRGRPRAFQDFRVWGSMGFMVPSLGLALAFRGAPLDPSLLVHLTLAITLAAVVCSTFLPPNSPTKHATELPSKQALLAATRRPLRDFFIASFMVGMALGIYFTYFPRFLQEMGCSIVEVGLIINLGVLFEVLLMPFGRRLIDRFGLERIMLIGFLSLPLRMFLMVICPTLPMVIAVQLLHAPLALGLFVSTPVYLQRHAQPSYRHSLQSLNAALVVGLTRFIGPMVGATVIGSMGHLVPIESLVWAIATAGVLAVVAAVVFYRGSRSERAAFGR